jgi:hypothetical protein
MYRQKINKDIEDSDTVSTNLTWLAFLEHPTQQQKTIHPFQVQIIETAEFKYK